jgi:DNA-binding IclR family transcriptional regulator
MVAEILKRLKYSQSKTYRIIRVLVRYDPLQETPGTTRYSLGLNTFGIRLLAPKRFNLFQVARLFMNYS